VFIVFYNFVLSIVAYGFFVVYLPFRVLLFSICMYPNMYFVDNLLFIYAFCKRPACISILKYLHVLHAYIV
jgi:hypothetical protein